MSGQYQIYVKITVSLVTAHFNSKSNEINLYLSKMIIAEFGLNPNINWLPCQPLWLFREANTLMFINNVFVQLVLHVWCERENGM